MDVRLLWLSGRQLAAQARGVLDLTPSDCRPFHFPLFHLNKDVTIAYVYKIGVFIHQFEKCMQHIGMVVYILL